MGFSDFFKQMGFVAEEFNDSMTKASEKDQFFAATTGALTGATTGAVTSGGNPFAIGAGALVGGTQGIVDHNFQKEEREAAQDAQNVLNSLTAQQNSLIDPRRFNPQQQATQPTLIG